MDRLYQGLGWLDWTIRDKDTGNFHLYRNYKNEDGSYKYLWRPITDLIVRNENGVKKYYDPEGVLFDPEGIVLYKKIVTDTNPIAYGITAYFGADTDNSECLRTKIKTGLDFNKINLFNSYLNLFLLGAIKESLMDPTEESELEIKNRFLIDHLNNERKMLKRSSIFYKEVLNDEDRELTIRIYKFVEGYFQWLDSLRIPTKAEPELSLLKFSRDDANKKTIDKVLQICKDNLNGIKFDLMSYAALYLIIFDKYNNIFKGSTSFVDVQKMLDKYFNKDTRQYKPGKVKTKAEELKNKYKWIDTL